MSNLDDPTSTRSTARTGILDSMGWLTAILLFIGFYFIDHGWTQSIIYAGMEEGLYTGNENITADHLSQVNAHSTIARLGLAVWGCICIVMGWRRHQLRWINPPGIFLFMFLSVIAASILWSDNPSYTFFKLGVLATLGTLAYGLTKRFALDELLKIFAVSSAAFILLGIFAELALGTFRPVGEYRFIGTSHPNTQAIYGAVLCLAALMPWRSHSKDITLRWMIGLFGAAIIMLTKSRTTLMAAIFGVLVVQVLSVRKENRAVLVAASALLIGCVAIAAAIMSQGSIDVVSQAATMGRAEHVTSLTGRLPLWEELWISIKKAPLLGHGYLAYWDADRVEYLSELFQWEIPHGHNMYLDILLDVGFIGLTVLILCLVAMLVRASHRYATTGLKEYAVVAGLIVCAIVNGLAESLFKLPGFPLLVISTCFLALLSEERHAHR